MGLRYGMSHNYYRRRHLQREKRHNSQEHSLATLLALAGWVIIDVLSWEHLTPIVGFRKTYTGHTNWSQQLFDKISQWLGLPPIAITKWLSCHNRDASRYGRIVLPKRSTISERVWPTTSTRRAIVYRARKPHISQPLYEEIYDTIVSYKFKPPSLVSFDRKSGPQMHINAINIHMDIIGMNDSLECKLMVRALKEASPWWYMSLLRFLVLSYQDLQEIWHTIFWPASTWRFPWRACSMFDKAIMISYVSIWTNLLRISSKSTT